MFNIILRNNIIPLEWKTSWTLPVFKKGDKKNPSNYRGITIMDNMTKLFTGVILDLMLQYYAPQEEQFGFRKERSTTDTLFVVRQIIEKSIEYNCPVYVCLVDLEKAFDSIRISDVINLLNNKVPKI